MRERLFLSRLWYTPSGSQTRYPHWKPCKHKHIYVFGIVSVLISVCRNMYGHVKYIRGEVRPLTDMYVGGLSTVADHGAVDTNMRHCLITAARWPTLWQDTVADTRQYHKVSRTCRARRYVDLYDIVNRGRRSSNNFQHGPITL